MSSQQNIEFTIKFFDKQNNYAAQFDFNGILSASDLNQLESAMQPYALQLQFYMDGYVNEPETATVEQIENYITQTIEVSIGSRSFAGTTETAGFAGEIAGENVMFDIALPDGTVLHNQVVTNADYQSLAEDPVIASVTNVVSTTQPVTITFAQISAHFTTQTTAQPPQTGSSSGQGSSTLPLLKNIKIIDQNGVNWDVALSYQDGTFASYTLSSANVDYWIKNSQSVTDETGQFVPNTATGSTPTPAPAPTNTSSSSSSAAAVDQTNSQISQYQSQISQLQQQLASSGSAQSNLSAQITQLENEVTNLQNNGNTDSAEYSQTLQALNDAKNQLASLQSQDAQTKADLATASANVAQLTTQVQLLLTQLNKSQTGSSKAIPIIVTAIGFVSLGLGIAAIDPKKKTLAEVVQDKAKDLLGSTKRKASGLYCYKCNRKHTEDHHHIKIGFNKLKNKVKKFYESKGESPSEAEKSGQRVAGKVKAEVAAEKSS